MISDELKIPKDVGNDYDEIDISHYIPEEDSERGEEYFVFRQVGIGASPDMIVISQKQALQLAALIQKRCPVPDNTVREAMLDATVHLMAAAQCYERYAKRHSSLGKVAPDPFYKTRHIDFHKAADRTQKALNELFGANAEFIEFDEDVK